MNSRTILLSSLFFFFFLSSVAQIGGKYAYSFLEQPLSARIAALGGNIGAMDDNDINVGFVNPSLINPGMDNSIGLNYVNHFTGLNYGSIQYANTYEKAGSFVGSLQFMNYGQFDYADQAGNQSGTFGASDFALTIGWGRRLDSSFSIGGAAKLIYSYYESYNSFGLAVDVAGTYHTKTGWTMSLVARNLGYQFKPYTAGSRGSLPFDLQYVITKRLDHVPFRISLVYDHIEKWDLTYDDPLNPAGGTDPITGEPKKQATINKIADQFMRHIIVGGELYIGKNLVLRGGYNYRRRQELKIADRTKLVGFSWGFGVRISKFKINYSRATHHLVGSPNYLSLTFNLDSFRK